MKGLAIKSCLLMMMLFKTTIQKEASVKTADNGLSSTKRVKTIPFKLDKEENLNPLIPKSPFDKTSTIIELPDILQNHPKYFSQFTNLAESVNNRIKKYHHEFIGMYIVKFVTVYVTLLYYYYDLLFEKIGIFFTKYKHKKNN